MNIDQGSNYNQQPIFVMGFPGGSDGKESACNAGDLDSISGSGISPGEENDNPLQHSCLEIPMEPGRLQSMEVQRVRHNRSNLECIHAS